MGLIPKQPPVLRLKEFQFQPIVLFNIQSLDFLPCFFGLLNNHSLHHENPTNKSSTQYCYMGKQYSDIEKYFVRILCSLFPNQKVGIKE